MKTTFLIFIIALGANILGHAQGETTIYLKFTSTDILTDSRMYKQVNPLSDVDAEPSITFKFENKERGYFLVFSHNRYKYEEVTKIRPFTEHDFMIVHSIKKEDVDDVIIDMDMLTANWTKEEAWAFAKSLQKQNLTIYFIDTRDTKDGIYLLRQVKFSFSNSPNSNTIISDKEQLDKLKTLQKSNKAIKL